MRHRRSPGITPLGTATATVLLLVAGGCAADTGSEREAFGTQPDLPYSEAMRVGSTYYFAGKVGATDQTRTLDTGRTAAETRNVLDNFRGALGRLGLGFADVVNTNVYLVHIDDFDEMNAVYREYFPTAPPARTTVGVSGLPGGAIVEIALVAAREPGSR